MKPFSTGNAAAKADLFITNDDRFTQKSIPGVSFFIAGLSRAPV